MYIPQLKLKPSHYRYTYDIINLSSFYIIIPLPQNSHIFFEKTLLYRYALLCIPPTRILSKHQYVSIIINGKRISLNVLQFTIYICRYIYEKAKSLI